MKRFRSFVVRVSNALRAKGSLPVAAPPLSNWTDEDRDQFKTFLISTSGKRFIARLRAVESLNALSAVKNPANIDDIDHLNNPRPSSCRTRQRPRERPERTLN